MNSGDSNKRFCARRAISVVAVLFAGISVAACGGGGSGFLPGNPATTSGGGESPSLPERAQSGARSADPETRATFTGEAAQAEGDSGEPRAPQKLANKQGVNPAANGGGENDYSSHSIVGDGDFYSANDGDIDDFGDIGADAAYARGHTGEGVIIGVISGSGFRGAGAHSDLAGQFVGGYGLDNGEGKSDHGTGVASIIAGAKDGAGMHGVAYGAKISPILLAKGYGAFAREQSGARVLNFSWHHKVDAWRSSYYQKDPDGWNGLDPDGEQDAEAQPEFYTRYRYCGSSGIDRELCPESLGPVYKAVSPLQSLANPAYSDEFAQKLVDSDIIHVFAAGNEGRNAENADWVYNRVMERMYRQDENGKWVLDHRVHTDAFANYEKGEARIAEYVDTKENALASLMALIQFDESQALAFEKSLVDTEQSIAALGFDLDEYQSADDVRAFMAGITAQKDAMLAQSKEVNQQREALLAQRYAQSAEMAAEVAAASAASGAANREIDWDTYLGYDAVEFAGGDTDAYIAGLDETAAAAVRRWQQARARASELRAAHQAFKAETSAQNKALLAETNRLVQEAHELSDRWNTPVSRAKVLFKDLRNLKIVRDAYIRSALGNREELSRSAEALDEDWIFQYWKQRLAQAREAWEADDPANYAFSAVLPKNYVASLIPRTALRNTELQDIFLVAIGVLPEGDAYRIADKSNGCGDLKDFCLAAPFQALVADGDGDHKIVAGTSAAAGYVSGAAAVIMSAWPELSGADVARLLKETATPLCYRDGEHQTGSEACGDEPDDTYGNGLVNLDEATRPQGEPEERRIATSAGASHLPIGESLIVASPAFGNAFSDSGSAVGMFDSYDRIFSYPLEALTPDNSDKARDAFGLFAEDYLRGAEEQNIGGGFSVRQNGRGGLLAASYQAKAGAMNAAFSYSGRDCDSVASSKGGLHFAGGTAPAAPCQNRRTVFGFGAMFDDFADVGVFPLRERSAAARIGAKVANGTASFSVGEDKDAASGARYYRAAAKFAKQFGALRLAAEAGHIKERDTVLGARFSGGLGTDGGASTAYGRIAGLLTLGEGFRGYASVIEGRTRAAPLAGGAISDISRIHSRGFHFGLGKDGLIDSRDSLRLDISRPLAVTGGELTIDGRDAANPRTARETRIDLAGDAHTRASVFYRRKSGALASAFGVEHILNSPARGYNGDETVLSAALRYDF